jgi:hypothetical protein
MGTIAAYPSRGKPLRADATVVRKVQRCRWSGISFAPAGCPLVLQLFLQDSHSFFEVYPLDSRRKMSGSLLIIGREAMSSCNLRENSAPTSICSAVK